MNLNVNVTYVLVLAIAVVLKMVWNLGKIARVNKVENEALRNELLSIKEGNARAMSETVIAIREVAVALDKEGHMARIAELEAKIEELNGEIKKKDTMLNDLRKSYADKLQEVETLQELVTSTEAVQECLIRDFKAKISDMEVETNSRVQAAEAKVEEMTEDIRIAFSVIREFKDNADILKSNVAAIKFGLEAMVKELGKDIGNVDKYHELMANHHDVLFAKYITTRKSVKEQVAATQI